MVFCFLVRRTAPRQPVCCGGFFSIIQFSNISSDLRYKNNHKANRSIGQSTLTKRSSYFHIRWLRHFPKVKHYPLSGLVSEGSTDVQGKSQTCTGCERQCPPGAVGRGGEVFRVRIFTVMALPASHARACSSMPPMHGLIFAGGGKFATTGTKTFR